MINIRRKKSLLLGTKVICAVLGEVAVNDPMRKLKFIIHKEVIYFRIYLLPNHSDVIEHLECTSILSISNFKGVCAKFRRDRFRFSEVVRGDARTDIYTDFKVIS
jgi:hypothetical protein